MIVVEGQADIPARWRYPTPEPPETSRGLEIQVTGPPQMPDKP